MHGAVYFEDNGSRSLNREVHKYFQKLAARIQFGRDKCSEDATKLFLHYAVYIPYFNAV